VRGSLEIEMVWHTQVLTGLVEMGDISVS